MDNVNNMAFQKGYGKYKYQGNQKPSGMKGPSAEKYRVKGSVKSFRDLEVYQKTTKLSSEIFLLKTPVKAKADIAEELVMLRDISKQIPRLIAESYGDKWSNRKMALGKLETAMRYVSDIVTKVDFLTAVTDGDTSCEELREALADTVKKYQVQRVKIRNLKKAWEKYDKT